MKRFYSFALALCMAVLTASAQWQCPVPKTTEFVISESDTTYFYLYNAEAAAFFNQGNDWGFRATYLPTGLKTFFTKYVEVVDNVPQEWDGKSLLFHNFNTSGLKKVFINEENFCYVDYNGQANYFWQIEDLGNGSYHIYGGDRNPLYNTLEENYPNCFLGINLDENSTIIYPLLDINVYPNCAIEWQFVSEEDYEVYLNKYNTYREALSLKAAIDGAKELGVDVSEEEKIFADTSSSLEQLSAAVLSVAEKVNKFKETTASPSSPQDLTVEFIQNYTFDNGYAPWKTTTGAKNNQTKNTAGKLGDDTSFWENWKSTPFSGKMYIEMANIPDGVYHFGLSAAMNGGEGYVYANGSRCYVKNVNMTPYHVFTYVDGRMMEAGLEVINNSTGWCGIDDASLLYFGNTDESYQFLAKGMMEDVPDFDADGTYVQKSLLEEFVRVRDELASKTAKDEITALIPSYQDAYLRILANLNAYDAYKNEMVAVEAAMAEENLNGDAADELADYLMMYVDDVLMAGEMSTEEILAETQRIKDLLTKARAESIKGGEDVTKLIVNPDFNDKLNGWSHDGKYANGTVGGTTDNPCVEVYNNNYDIYQELNVPDGVYELRVQACYRPYDGTDLAFYTYMDNPEADPILAYIYANGYKKPIRNIAEFTTTEALDGTSMKVTYNDETLYLPSGMSSASMAFSRGAYENVVYGLVTDGKLRIGITSTEGTNFARWTLWDNFRLTYWEKDAALLRKLLEDLIQEVAAQTAGNRPMNAQCAKILEEAINAASSALESGDGDEMFSSCQALTDAFTAAKSSMVAYQKLASELEELNSALEKYYDTARTEAFDMAASLYDKVDNGITDGTYSEEDVDGVISEISAAITSLKVPKDSNASDDNPLDMTSVIVNPTFTNADLSGWSGTQWSRGGTVDDCAEHFNKTYDTYQDIVGLEEGTYGVGVQAFYRKGLAADDWALFNMEDPSSTDYAILYAVGEEENTQAIAAASSAALPEAPGGAYSEVGEGLVIPNSMEAGNYWFINGYYQNMVYVNVGADGKLRIGTRKEETISNDWVLVDNWTLTYYGKDSVHNPSTGISNVSNAAEMHYGVYDMTGRRMTSDWNSLPAGIYISGGKKFLKK